MMIVIGWRLELSASGGTIICMRMSTRATSVIAIAAALAVVSLALGQVPRLPPTPLDQSRADVGPLSSSLREMQPELRLPTGFQNVYRVPGHDDLLMRMDGGLIAVFPRSTYVRTGKHGSRAVIPPGTVFHIGPPIDPTSGEWATWSTLGAALPHRSHLQSVRDNDAAAEFDLRVDAQLDEEAHAPALASQWMTRHNSRLVVPDLQVSANPYSPMSPTMANDQAYRSARVSELLKRASGAAAATSQPSVKLDAEDGSE
jgi:hypothetical protein